MPTKEPEDHLYRAGDHVKVNLHHGRLVDATIAAIIDYKDGRQFQVDFGKEQTALVEEWQIVKN